MKKIAIVFGGSSCEHEVSITSATSMIKAINKKKYNIDLIYIAKNGVWYKYTKDIETIKETQIEKYAKDLEKIDNIVKQLQIYDIIFPILHGKYGEDGSIQGLFEMIGKKYVGSGVLASSLCMDKIYTKIIIDKAKIKQAKYLYLKYEKNKYIYIDDEFNEKNINLKTLNTLIINKLNYPVFIKPSRSGSSVGISKVNNIDELSKALEIAKEVDNKILIEEAISGKEVECAILEDNKIIASTLGEILTDDHFYSYYEKYESNKENTLIPARVDKKQMKKVQQLAIKAFKAVDAKDLARIDFFITDKNEIYLNEINTIPGFTEISMYPKLFSYDKIEYSKLIDRLIK